MKLAKIKAAVLKEAGKRMDMGEASDYDYKDVANEFYNRICEVLFDHPRLEHLFENMPDGFNCPRSFLEWVPQ
jgi:hypothetical protein